MSEICVLGCRLQKINATYSLILSVMFTILSDYGSLVASEVA